LAGFCSSSGEWRSGRPGGGHLRGDFFYESHFLRTCLSYLRRSSLLDRRDYIPALDFRVFRGAKDGTGTQCDVVRVVARPLTYMRYEFNVRSFQLHALIMVARIEGFPRSA
jgi:hypothetical protein